MSTNCISSDGNLQSISIAEHTINYIQKGENPQIVLLAPPLSDGRIICELQNHLKKFSSIILSIPLSNNLNGCIDIVEESITQLSPNIQYLIGISASGWLAQFISSNLKIKGLIFVNSYLDNDFLSKFKTPFKTSIILPGFLFKKAVKKATKYLSKGLTNSKQINSHMRQRIDKLGKSTIRKHIPILFENKISPTVNGMNILAIHNKTDPIIKRKESKRFTKNFQNITVENYKGKSHLSFIENTEFIATKILDFINNKR